MKFSVLSFVILINVINKETNGHGHESKGSLAFVIDNTDSMREEIRQVKKQTKKLFDAVFNSSTSQINEFILVTFNDPNTEVRAVTKNRNEFKMALNKITRTGGGDCPEVAMKGILTALEKCAHNSFVYVFTDASAKDYSLFEEVKSLSQKKSIQVTFLLTGTCPEVGITNKGFQVYNNIAVATSGQVFLTKKKNLHEILEYVTESVKNKRTSLSQKFIKAGFNSISFNVDSKINNVMISASGLIRNMTVVDSEGNAVENHVLVYTPYENILQLNYTKPGSYEIKIYSDAKNSSVFVSGSTTICFQHGFSYNKPTSINETYTQPISGKKSYLSIALTNSERDVTLKSAELRDTDGIVIITVPVKLEDYEQQLYVTEPFDPPEKMFKIAINGYSDTKEYITRVGATFIELQKPVNISSVHNKSPKVTILGDTEVSTEIDKPLNLKCKVEAFPKPEITWENDIGEKFEPEVMTLDLPSDYKSTLHIEKVDKNTTYHCKAKNFEGEDAKSVNVYLQIPEEKKEPPLIKTVGSEIRASEGETINMACLVEGTPLPDVKWLRNSDELSNGHKYQIFRDHTLRFQAKLGDTGNYTCTAKNTWDVAQIDFSVYVYVPVNIEIPKETTIKLRVGSALNLPCSASGYPEPTVKFIHLRTDPKPSTKNLKEAFKRIEVYYGHIQELHSGYYICVASNAFSSKNLTYTVIVEVPAYIKDSYNTNLYAVEGDLVLKIPCEAHGNPKPTIIWLYNGLNLAESDNEIIEDDGTLVLMYLNSNLIGSYTCVAANYISKDMKTYELNVGLYPEPPKNFYKVTKNFVVEGKPRDIKCDIPHNPGDKIRWYKDGNQIKIGELRLLNPTKSDDGMYTCRISDTSSSHSYHTVVTVGFQPRFITDESDEPIQFIEGSRAVLECSAVAYPKPKTVWILDNEKIRFPFMTYNIKSLKSNDIGVYKCVITNDFGSISRTFHIKSEKCQMSIYNDFNGNQPLILDGLKGTFKWPLWETSNGMVQVPEGKQMNLMCPGSFLTYHGLKSLDSVQATCIKDSLFKVKGKEIKFSDLKCVKKIEPHIKKNNIPCIRTKSELYTIGYKYGSEFLGVYDICFDKRRNVPVFSKHSLHKSISTIIPKEEPEIIASTDMEYNFNELYDHSRQLNKLSSILGKKFKSDSCHFSKRQLVNSRDVLPGLSQAATYNYLNIMPHWSPCYNENWEEIENRVRSAALSGLGRIDVWTGTSESMRLPHQHQDTDVYLHDKLNRKQFVPLYLWKVVQSFELSGSIAIIQINLPNLTLPQALSYVKCEDICDKIEWLRYDDWHNVKKGYTYCCNIIDFEKKFNYRGLFSSRGPPNVLTKISNVDKTKE